MADVCWMSVIVEAPTDQLETTTAFWQRVTGTTVQSQSEDRVLLPTDGDPLEVTTLPEQVYVGGQAVPTTSRQTLLRDRYRDLGSDPLPAYRHP